MKPKKMKNLTAKSLIYLFWCDSANDASLRITTERRLKNSSQLTISVWNMCPVIKNVRNELSCIVVTS